jgi:hypothetical protein
MDRRPVRVEGVVEIEHVRGDPVGARQSARTEITAAECSARRR